jgi:hypothetical protein
MNGLGLLFVVILGFLVYRVAKAHRGERRAVNWTALYMIVVVAAIITFFHESN